MVVTCMVQPRPTGVSFILYRNILGPKTYHLGTPDSTGTYIDFFILSGVWFIQVNLAKNFLH
jgi:hypothetical protein